MNITIDPASFWFGVAAYALIRVLITVIFSKHRN